MGPERHKSMMIYDIIACQFHDRHVSSGRNQVHADTSWTSCAWQLAKLTGRWRLVGSVPFRLSEWKTFGLFVSRNFSCTLPLHVSALKGAHLTCHLLLELHFLSWNQHKAHAALCSRDGFVLVPRTTTEVYFPAFSACRRPVETIRSFGLFPAPTSPNWTNTHMKSRPRRSC